MMTRYLNFPTFFFPESGLERYFLDLGVTADNLKTDYNLESEHCLPTLTYGEPCATLREPYLGSCKYDGAGQALLSITDLLNPPTAMIDSNLFTFSQVEFNQWGDRSSINDIGFVYIPTLCQGSNSFECKLHISFHGCKQNVQIIGDTYAR